MQTGHGVRDVTRGDHNGTATHLPELDPLASDIIANLQENEVPRLSAVVKRPEYHRL